MEELDIKVNITPGDFFLTVEHEYPEFLMRQYGKRICLFYCFWNVFRIRAQKQVERKIHMR